MDTQAYTSHESSMPSPQPDAQAYDDFILNLPRLQNFNPDTLLMMDDPGLMLGPSF